MCISARLINGEVTCRAAKTSQKTNWLHVTRKELTTNVFIAPILTIPVSITDLRSIDAVGPVTEEAVTCAVYTLCPEDRVGEVI